LEPIKTITVKGNLSGKAIRLEVKVIYDLVNAYMTIIPNEKRTLPEALNVLRFHEYVRELFDAEEKAGKETINRKFIEEEEKDI
jgi:hypothetical protein